MATGTGEPAATTDVVLRFLESVGRPAEARFYLDLFRAAPAERFAAACVDANVARDAEEAVALDLRFLAALGLYPTVILGLFAPADAESHSRRLARRLERAGVAVSRLDATEAGLAEAVRAAARGATVPIVAFGPEDGRSASERFDALAALLVELRTGKLLFLRRPGGLRVGGQLVPLVNLTTEAAALQRCRDLSRKERLVVEMARRLVVERAPHRLLVAVTSPMQLFGELFTVKGAGTLLRRGATVRRHGSLAGLDRRRLRDLLASAFGRPPVDAFFERAVGPVYLEEDYRGAAVLESTPLAPYMTKFAVSPEAQGEGLARDLWDAMRAEVPALFWRARPGNPIVPWYDRICDGLQRVPDWNVYWVGLPSDRIPEAVERALARPIDVPPAAAPPVVAS